MPPKRNFIKSVLEEKKTQHPNVYIARCLGTVTIKSVDCAFLPMGPGKMKNISKTGMTEYIFHMWYFV